MAVHKMMSVVMVAQAKTIVLTSGELIKKLSCWKKATSLANLVCIEDSRTSIIKTAGLNM